MNDAQFLAQCPGPDGIETIKIPCPAPSKTVIHRVLVQIEYPADAMLCPCSGCRLANATAFEPVVEAAVLGIINAKDWFGIFPTKPRITVQREA
jgi:hypothetical protein